MYEVVNGITVGDKYFAEGEIKKVSNGLLNKVCLSR
jgi:hypothetical protein